MPKRKHTAFEKAFVILLVIVYLLPIECSTAAASVSSPIWTHLVCQFFHANIFHLIANLCVLWSMQYSWMELCIAYILSIPATFITLQPVIGVSSVIYVLLASHMIISKLSWKIWVIFSVMNAITAFIPSIAFTVHATSFSLGILYTTIKLFADDYRRACSRR